MNIVYDYQIFSWQRYGGISRYFIEISRAISLYKNINVSIITPFYVNNYLNDNLNTVEKLGVKIPFVKRSGKLISFINYYLSIPLISNSEIDILHQTYYSSKSISSSSNFKIVVTVHDMIHELFRNDFSKSDTTSKRKLASIKRADHIICISNNTRNDLINILGVNPDKISVVYHGFSLSKNLSNYSINNVSFKRPYLLYVGQRQGYKNFLLLLKAYAQSKSINNDYNLVAFGGGTWTKEELNCFENLNIPIEKLINIQGDDEILTALYKNAKVFVYPSLYEGFGIPPLEAMSFGCPVIASNSSSMPEVIGNAAVYFDAKSISSLKSSLFQVLSNSSLCESLVELGYERIKLFSWEKCATDTLNIYKSIIQ
jgi:glycosyltransferase involved in cell wall biosynthesis